MQEIVAHGIVWCAKHQCILYTLYFGMSWIIVCSPALLLCSPQEVVHLYLGTVTVHQVVVAKMQNQKVAMYEEAPIGLAALSHLAVVSWGA